MDTRFEASIVRLVRDRGFGFVKATLSGQEYFFHRSACLTPFERLKEGQVVTCEEEAHPKGPRCTNLQVVEIS